MRLLTPTSLSCAHARLMGDLLRPYCSTLVGVDIAPAMVLAARARRAPRKGGEEGIAAGSNGAGQGLVYDEVREASILEALVEEQPGQLDVVVAADVLVRASCSCLMSSLVPLVRASRAARAYKPYAWVLLRASSSCLQDQVNPGS